MKSFYLRHRRSFLLAALLLILFSAWALYLSGNEVTDKAFNAVQTVTPSFNRKLPNLPNEFRRRSTMETCRLEQKAEITVDIKGAVQHSGLYKLSVGASLHELIEKAGGFTAAAAREYINLAMTLQDRCLYRIPDTNEIRQLEQEGINVLKPGIWEVLPPVYRQKLPNQPEALNPNSVQVSRQSGCLKQLNLNTCTLEELSEVPYVGRKLAEKIIAYRQTHGHFSNLTNLLQISGIKERKLQQIKKYLAVN